MAAVMAQHATVAAVVGKGDRAVDALHALATGAAGDEVRKAAAVMQHNYLLPRMEPRADRFDQTPRERGLLPRFEEFRAHVDQLDLRQSTSLHPFRQLEQ